MPFGLRNAPAVFQRLMQHILMSVYPQTGPTFVSAYLDDIIIFSKSFEDHLCHIRHVIQCFADTGLKFKPSKCHFICQQVEYLGHLITPSGILPKSSSCFCCTTVPCTVLSQRSTTICWANILLSPIYQRLCPHCTATAQFDTERSLFFMVRTMPSSLPTAKELLDQFTCAMLPYFQPVLHTGN